MSRKFQCVSRKYCDTFCMMMCYPKGYFHPSMLAEGIHCHHCGCIEPFMILFKKVKQGNIFKLSQKVLKRFLTEHVPSCLPSCSTMTPFCSASGAGISLVYIFRRLLEVISAPYMIFLDT